MVCEGGGAKGTMNLLPTIETSCIGKSFFFPLQPMCDVNSIRSAYEKKYILSYPIWERATEYVHCLHENIITLSKIKGFNLNFNGYK